MDRAAHSLARALTPCDLEAARERGASLTSDEAIALVIGSAADHSIDEAR